VVVRAMKASNGNHTYSCTHCLWQPYVQLYSLLMATIRTAVLTANGNHTYSCTHC